ncbi:unnamed protein product [Heligmosomoides polygyrus]|uniref:PseudoU_synth_2 domain-containing protein n=1 Tax=Heligmosomoides polygyrus TaxID=6339 RepID=A0A3P8CPR5_HELPZ|nr:unnamed protein product [Heligmosomoides polygyrus]
MSEKSAADDFFGIEYMSSQPQKTEVKEEVPSSAVTEPTTSSRRSFRIRSTADVVDMERDSRQLSGTEFLDRAFFPQLELSDRISQEDENSGLGKIRAGIIPVWRMNEEELVDLMTERVLYRDDNIVAFDKPYGMAYSGSSKTAPQLDRLLQKIKARVAPRCERLYLVRSLDKYQSGIVLFATNAAMQSTLKENIKSGLVEQISRCVS